MNKRLTLESGCHNLSVRLQCTLDLLIRSGNPLCNNPHRIRLRDSEEVFNFFKRDSKCLPNGRTLSNCYWSVRVQFKNLPLGLDTCNMENNRLVGGTHQPCQ